MVQDTKSGEGEIEGVAELDVAALTPESFWAAHIAARKPALLHGHPTDLGWRASSLWTDDYLIRKAGGASVLVEVRGGSDEGYGRGVKRRMSFGEFIGKMAAGGETGLYLTAQEVAVAPDGHPQLLAEPLLSLAGAAGCSTNASGGGEDDGSSSGSGRAAAADFPASLELAGHLVPQSLNLWMGAAPEGSSSGLHHDFHDNIYVLLRGRKRFRLYSPAAAPTMYTYGKLTHLYGNGRIVYEGQGDILADGTDAADVARWRRRTVAEAAVAEAEAAVARGEPGAQVRLEQSEAALEAVLAEELSDALEDGEEGDDDDDDKEEEEEDGSDEEDSRGCGGRDGDGDGGWVGKRRRGKALAAAAAGPAAAAAEEEKKQGGGGGGDGRGAIGGGDSGGGLIVDLETPPSFSRVPLGDPWVSDAQLATDFPRFLGRAAALEVTMEAGDMLYLPAGWFHEVTSYGSTGSPDGGHLAFNYWFHPPDNLDPSRCGFRAPYSSDFWPSLWRARVAEGLPGAMEPGLGAQPPLTRSPAVEVRNDADAYAGGGANGGAGGAEWSGKKRSRGAAAAAPASAGGAGEAAANGEAAVNGDVGGVVEGVGARPRQRARHCRPGGARVQQQPQSEGSDGGGGGDGDDLDPPRRRPATTAAARALMAKLAAMGKGSSDGDAATGLTEEEYQLLMAMEAARRRNAAVHAMRVFFEKQMKLQRYRRMRSRLPPGRRHHPVISVSTDVRNWRPIEQQKQTQQDHQQPLDKRKDQTGGRQLPNQELNRKVQQQPSMLGPAAAKSSPSSPSGRKANHGGGGSPSGVPGKLGCEKAFWERK